MTVLMNSGVYKGAHNVLLPRFDPDAVFGLLEKHDVTIFAGVPTMYWGMVNFDASSSSDPNGEALTYSWDFGDGNQGTGEVTMHTYTQAGSYFSTLIVEDPGGKSDTTSIMITQMTI